MKALALGALLVAIGVPARAQVLVRRPYLQQQTPRSIVIAWRTDRPTDSVVELGASPGALTRRVVVKEQGVQHEVLVADLVPGQRVYYAVGSSKGRLAGGDAEHHLAAAPATGSRPRIRAWVVGDSGVGDTIQAAVRESMLRFVGNTPPTLLLHMGDMAYDSGTRLQFTELFFRPYQDLLRRVVTWPTMGNHEGLSSDSGTQTGPYYEAYVLPTRGEAGGLPSGTEAYYSFDHGNVHFVVLDSHDSPRTPDGAMLRWLERDLAATSQEWLIAYWHHPPYSKGPHDSDRDPREIDMRTYALPILEAAGVDLVLAGHSHIYERSFLIDGAYETPTRGAHRVRAGDGRPLGTGPYVKRPGKNAHDGAVYVVAGHGGAMTGRIGTHPVMYFTEAQNGSCILDIEENRLELVNIRVDGQLSDRFAMVKGKGLVVAQPGGGERLVAGRPVTVRWVTVGDVTTVKLSASYDGGATFVPLGEAPNTGRFEWTPPAISTRQALVRVEDAGDARVRDSANAFFAIRADGAPAPLGVAIQPPPALAPAPAAPAPRTSCQGAPARHPRGLAVLGALALAAWRRRRAC